MKRKYRLLKCGDEQILVLQGMAFNHLTKKLEVNYVCEDWKREDGSVDVDVAAPDGLNLCITIGDGRFVRLCRAEKWEQAEVLQTIEKEEA